MKGPGKLKGALAFTLSLPVWLAVGSPKAEETPRTSPSGPNSAYTGRWDLTVRIPTHERPSWIEISESGGALTGLMVGLWGHATPTGKIHINDGQMEFTAPALEGFPEGTVFSGRLVNGALAGTATARNGASWRWTGRRAPALAGKGTPKFGSPIRLLNGKDLSGWTLADPTQASAWSVEDGTLVKQGRGSEILTTSKFQDFNLHVEFNCGTAANSGVYLRGRYEVQIEDNAAQEPVNRRMGAVYGFIAPEPGLPRTPNTWETYDITLIGRTITVVHNGHTVIDHKEIPGITGGAFDSDEASPGPIYLQGTEDGRVAFRNIVLTPAE